MRGRITLGVAGLLVATLLTAGCVERRMTVRTNPPGAVVYVDHKEVGVSPASYHFVHYGTSQIRLVKDGYQTKTVVYKITPPVYQWFMIDLLAELAPFQIKDEHEITFELARPEVVSSDELKQRAEALRRDAQAAGEEGPEGAENPGM